MRRIKYVALALFLGLCYSFVRHEVYVSSTELVITEPQREIQLTVRVFTDDLEQVLQTRYEATVLLDPDKNGAVIDSLLANYLQEAIQMQTASGSIALRFLGKEYRDDLSMLYLEGQLETGQETFDLEHRLFLKEIPSQQNIVHLKHNNDRKSFLYDKRQTTRTIQLTPLKNSK